MDITAQQYRRLGHKTLFLMICKRTLILFFILIILAAVIIIDSLNIVPSNYSHIATWVIYGLIGLFVLVGLIILLSGWLEYIHYGIYVGEQDFKITHGVISEEEMGVPYRQIKDVKIQRSLTDQIFGVSNIVITVLGESGGRTFSEESTIILPMLEKNMADQIQDLILQKAQVEEVNMVPEPSNNSAQPPSPPPAVS